MSEHLTSLPLSTLLQTAKLLPPDFRQTQAALDQFPGLRIGKRRGQGLEFDDLRQYQSGDDIRHIDWNVTARAGEPYTRLYRDEREHSTTVIVDLRAPMFTGSSIVIAVRAGQLAAAVLWQAMRNGDRCSAVVFSANGIQATRPVAGARGVTRACELIASQFQQARNAVSQRENTAGDGHSAGCGADGDGLEQLFDWLQRAGRRSGSKLLFSGFTDLPQARWAGKLKAAGIGQTLTAIMLIDPLESSGLGPGTYHYKSSSNRSGTPVARTLHSAAVSHINEHLATMLHETKLQFDSANVPLLNCVTSQSPASLLAQLALRQLI